MDAVFEDIINAFNEEAEWAAFVRNTGKSLSKGPTVLAKRLKECRELHAQANSIINAFHQGCLDADIMKHTDPDRYFIASKSAKHRVPKSFPQNNPMQDGAYTRKEKVMEKLLIQTSVLEVVAVVNKVETVTQIWALRGYMMMWC